ncbi:MAG: serine hydrolase domain-containing protein [Parcubacteria group bacterium]
MISKSENKIRLAVKEVGHLLDVWLPLRLEYDKVPGVSIAITYKDKILYKKGFGYSNLEKKVHANEKTLYHIASISKTFTSVAILQLVEQKKIRLNDRVVKYVKWFKGKNKNGSLENITIKQLLSNTSGIWRDGDTPHWVTGRFPKELRSKEIADLIFKSGSEFKYSNYGFSILGEVIESVTSLKYEEYVEKNILNRLGMNSTSPDYKKGLKNIAEGYGRVIPDYKREKFNHYTANAYAPATGFVSNAVDLAKYITNLPVHESKKLLKDKTKQIMFRPIKITEDKDKYCLGIEMYNLDGKKIYGHSGGFQGFLTQIAFDPVNQLGIVVLTNALGAPVWVYAQSIFQGIYDIVKNDSDYSSKSKTGVRKYEGIYRNLWGDQVVVKIKDTLVSFGVGTRSPLQKNNKSILLSKGKNVFQSKGGSVFGSRGELVKFDHFKNGKSQSVIFGATPGKRL